MFFGFLGTFDIVFVPVFWPLRLSGAALRFIKLAQRFNMEATPATAAWFGADKLAIFGRIRELLLLLHMWT